MKAERLAIADLLLIEPTRFGDDRGFFSEVFSRRALAAHGITADFVQDNHSPVSYTHLTLPTICSV